MNSRTDAGNDSLIAPTASSKRRWTCFGFLTALLSFVSDGWSGKPSLLFHQICLVPLAAAFGFAMFQLLKENRLNLFSGDKRTDQLPRGWWILLVCFQFLSMVMILLEARHFRSFGYKLRTAPCALASCVVVAAWFCFAVRRTGAMLFSAVLATYLSGFAVAIKCFPLNYLRSDMLPVISWADSRLLQHLDPYKAMHVGDRTYDFPYLPGILVAFVPAQALRSDLRFATLSYLIAAMVLVFLSARVDRRFEVAALLGLFLLCPFLQYRHDLYLEPHWFMVALAVVLMNRRHFGWSAVTWGVSCAVYQLSWVVVPFFFLNGLRRRGLHEALKLVALSLSGSLFVIVPFLKSAMHQIAKNTVTQWGHLPHAIADPINLSFWLTYLIRPDQLKWVQAVVLLSLFAYCCVTDRCRTTVDTLRWMVCALVLFIPLNVLVDGYFYLTLLLFLLLYVCLANDWWDTPTLLGVQ